MGGSNVVLIAENAGKCTVPAGDFYDLYNSHGLWDCYKVAQHWLKSVRQVGLGGNI